ncbi:hypothetical protein FB460_1491 [Propioniferax innocua]|uniref:Polymerase/histidinol phosphatase N-terminal domain-containing protein n=2 Tax=Propioniferax innocua TaxID=1753 RepID=A0A542ZBD6_9ACTN|nr:hypothetical protein FB460_1491 [Propioniferax innocua]
MIIDLHTHSLVSDGTDRPAEVMRRAARLGVDVIALTDHDTFSGHAEAEAAAHEMGIEFVPGMEMSTTLGGRSVHLLAYGADTSHAPLLEELERIRRGRTERVPRMVARLEELGVPITVEDVIARAGGDSVGRPHVADALVAAGHVADRAEAFNRYLHDGGLAHVGKYESPLPEAIDLLHDAGAVTVIAHPWGRGSRDVLDGDTIGRLARDHRLDGIEIDHGDHGPRDSAMRGELRSIARTHGLLVTGSSDYHGTGKVGHEIASETTAPGVWERIRARMT